MFILRTPPSDISLAGACLNRRTGPLTSHAAQFPDIGVAVGLCNHGTVLGPTAISTSDCRRAQPRASRDLSVCRHSIWRRVSRSALGCCIWTGEFQRRNRNCTAVGPRSTCKADRFLGGYHGSMHRRRFGTRRRMAQRDWLLGIGRPAAKLGTSLAANAELISAS